MGSTAAGAGLVSADEFQALEQKVLRAVEVLRREREARAAAEAEVVRLREELSQQKQEHASAQDAKAEEIEGFRRERDEVRQRVEKMLHQMDELL